MLNNILPEFQRFLVDKSLASERHAPFYARWASKFLAYSNNNSEPDLEKRMESFLAHLLKDHNIADWQVDQARNALKLYIYHYDGNDLSKVAIDKLQIIKNTRLDLPHVIISLRNSIKIKHYAYKTERSYIGWVKRFYEYITKIKKKDMQKSGLSSEDVCDYLSFMRLQINNSPQNFACL